MDFLPALFIVSVIGVYEWWTWYETEKRRSQPEREREELLRLQQSWSDPVRESRTIWVVTEQSSRRDPERMSAVAGERAERL